VIFATGGTAAALAARTATSTIPIVFYMGGDPVHQGLLFLVARPEWGNEIKKLSILHATLS